MEIQNGKTTNSTALNSTPAPCADDAVGVPDRKWFVGIVRNHSELQTAEILTSMGYECYVPVQEEVRKWKDGRKKIRKRILMPALILLHATEEERRQSLHEGLINRFMVNRALPSNEFARHPVAVIPDVQVERLRFMLYNAELPVQIESTPLRPGDAVRVVRGRLLGLVGTVKQHEDGRSKLFVSLDALGSATLEINLDSIEKITS